MAVKIFWSFNKKAEQEEIICNVRPSSYVIRNTVHVFVF